MSTEATPFKRNVNSGVVHHESCTRAGKCKPMSLDDVEEWVRNAPFPRPIAQCCGGSPGSWFKYNHIERYLKIPMPWEVSK